MPLTQPITSCTILRVTVTIPDRDLLAKLVSFPSVSGPGNDAAIIDFVCDYLDRPGIRVERIPSSDGTRCNLLIMSGGSELRSDRRGLILCGHLDVVPAEEPDWTSDPFTLTERDGKLFGRGACDMKASVAIAMNLLVNAAVRRLNDPLVGLFTFDEELGSLGAQEFTKKMKSRPPLPFDCIIGEPTSLRPVRMHKGHLKLRITITGKPAHSGSPHLGINAIEPAGELITKLWALGREFVEYRNRQSDCFDSVPFPVLTVARIHGGKAINVIPDRCEVDIGIRLLPGMSSVDAISRVQLLLRSVQHRAGMELMVVNDSPPMLLDDEAAIATAMKDLSGRNEDFGVSFASDAGVLQRDLEMRCILFGPGTIEVAHRPDEHVPIAEFERCADILAKLVNRWCEE